MKQWRVALFIMCMCGLWGGVWAQEATTITQRGKVTDSHSGAPLVGVTVLEVGSQNGTITDAEGTFSLEISEGATLRFEYLGYIMQELPATGAELAVQMQEDMIGLDEVVVIGYGTSRKSDLSTSVGSIQNMDKLMYRPVTGAGDVLQGQIPGVTIVQQGGHPDQGAQLMIRGRGSRHGEAALFVVDGVPGAPFNVNEIENIIVLKDAASAAIYGAHAGASGVVLITTKKAKAGQARLQYDHSTGFVTPTNLPQSLTIEEQRKVRAVALGGENNLPTGWDKEKNPYIATTRTDWIDEVFRTALLERNSVAVSGGNEALKGRAFFAHNLRQGTLLNTYNEGYIARANGSWLVNPWIRVREDVSYSFGRSAGANTGSAESGVILNAMQMPRNAEVYGWNGEFGGTATEDPEYIAKYGGNFADIHGDAINPVRLLLAKQVEDGSHNFTTTTFLDILEPGVKGLNFTSRFTYTHFNYFERGFLPRRLEVGKPDLENFLWYSANSGHSWSNDNTLSYDRDFGKHNLGLMMAFTLDNYTARGFSEEARTFQREEIKSISFAEAGHYEIPEDWYAIDRNMGIVARASYSWGDRYFISASWRRDYASRLPKANRYGDFPAVTGAWKISSEPFMESIKEYVNLLKIRGSWGRIGNLGSVGMGYPYPMLSTYGTGSGRSTTRGGQVGSEPYIVNGKVLNSSFNSKLTWETSEQVNAGVDMVFLRNRLSMSFDWFLKHTFNLIRQRDVGWPQTTGLAPALVNDGRIRNTGVEFSVSWTERRGDWHYWLGGNLATLKNTVVDMGEKSSPDDKVAWLENVSFKGLNPYRTEEGQPICSYFLIKTDGVFQSDEEAAAYVNADGERIQPEAHAGDLKFVDMNGDGKIDEKDKVFMGNSMPKGTYAFNAGASWRGLSLSCMLQGVWGVKLFHGIKHNLLNASDNFNKSNRILKALDGPTFEVPRISAEDLNNNFATVSDWYLESGDYLRIKNITLSYDFTSLVQRWEHLRERGSTLSIAFSIDNVYTFTRYTGIDPEVGGIGMDGGQYPVGRTYSVSLRLQY